MNEGRTGFPATTTTTDRALRTIVFVASGSGRTNAPTHKHTYRDKWYEWYDVIRLSHIPCIQIIYLTGRSQEFKTINYQIVLFVIVFCALRPVLGIQCPVSCLSCPMCRVLCLLSPPDECPAPNAPIGTRKTIIMVAFYIIYCLCAGLCDCVCVN